MHSADISKLLKELCELGYLQSEGNGRGTWYHLKGIKDPNVTSNITSLDPNIACKGEKRMSKLKLEMLILSQCVAYVSLEELAKRVNRNPLYLKNFIIPDMIDKGLIERLYPLSPRHPDQKYREKKDK